MKKTIFYYVFLITIFISQNIFAQNEENIYKDLKFLSSDALKGREAGTPGEIKARNYIVKQFKETKLLPFFDNKSFINKFEFKDELDYSKGTKFVVDKQKLKLDVDFYPLSKTVNGEIEGKGIKVGYGLISEDGSVDDYKNLKDIDGKVFIIEMSMPDELKNKSEYSEIATLDSKILTAQKKGAKAIIFINTDFAYNDLENNRSNNIEDIKIPVLFVTSKKSSIFNENKTYNLDIEVNGVKKESQAYNIAGYIDNGAKKSIIIGAHYDHLGMGGENSRYKGPPAIHNGADDNASGVAAMLELARYFKQNPIKKYNIIFMAFSAEEKGLLGSAHFVKSNYFDPQKILAMINFDMVGRLDSTHRTLNLIGTGTGLEWDSIIKITDNVNLDVKKSSSGISGSDQMSFYLHQIPVLFFFTGLHSDYHTPTDDIEFINFDGERDVVKYGINIINTIDKFDTITYNKTKDSEAQNSHRSYRTGITLGIVPDFSNEAEGMGIQAVLDDKPAFKAGLKNGDLIIKLGDKDVKNIQDYMNVLKTLKKGDRKTVDVIRDGKTLRFELQF